MTSSLVGSARVEIVGDLEGFAATAEGEITEIMAKLGVDVDSGLADVDAAFAKAGEASGAAFAEAVGAGTKGATAAVDESAAAADATGRAAWAELGANCGESMAAGLTAGVGEGSVGLGAEVDAEAAKLGTTAPVKFGEAGAKAGEAFGDSAKEAVRGLSGTILAGVGALGIAEVAKASVEAADQLEGANIKVEHIFGESGAAVQQWAKGMATSFGLSQSSAETLAGSFAQILQPLGLGTGQMAGMSEKLTGLTQDMARFNNADPASVQTALIAGLRGRATALRQYGVDISSTMVTEEAYRSGIAKQGATLTDAQKTQAAYNLILQQTAKQEGAVGDSSKTLAQQKQILEAQVKNLEASFGNELFPALTKVATFMAQDFVPDLRDVGTWIKNNSSWIVPLVAALGTALVVFKGVTGAINLFQRAQEGVRATMAGLNVLFGTQTGELIEATAANEAYNAAMAEGATAAEAAAAAQAELDGAMDANPIGLIVAAIAALVVGVIYAYTHFQTFRDIVQDVFKVVETIITGTYRDVIKPAFDGIVTAIDFVRDHWKIFAAGLAIILGPITIIVAAIVGLSMHWKQIMAALETAWTAVWHALEAAWTTVGLPIFNIILDTLKVLWTIFYLGTIYPIELAWNALWALMRLAWTTVGQPIFNAIIAAARFMWAGIQPIINAFVAFWRVQWNALMAVWRTVGQPIMNAIEAGIRAVQSVWNSALNGMKATWSAVLSAASSIYHSVLAPAFSAIQSGGRAIGSGIQWAWNNVIHPVVSAISGAFGSVVTAFHSMVSGISGAVGSAWGAVRGVFNGVIGLINDGINILDRIHIHVPHVPGTSIGGDFGVNIPNIPSLYKGGDLQLGYNIVGEEGPEAIYNSGSRQSVMRADATAHAFGSNGNDKQASAFSDDDRALLMAVANRPQVLAVDSVKVAQANNNGQLRLARRSA